MTVGRDTDQSFGVCKVHLATRKVANNSSALQRLEFTDLSHLDRSKEEVAPVTSSPQTHFWRYPESTQYTRDEVDHSPEPEWIQMENQPESAATGGAVLLMVQEWLLMRPS